MPSLPSVRKTIFQYESLRVENGFRLLKLHAGKGDLVCSLHHYTIGSGRCPPYRALSYTWDKSEPRHELQMPHGTILKVRKNLRDALRSLRDDKSDSFVWIDAICIDQISDEERNHQVRLMAFIYENANVVVVWLESAGEFVDIARAFGFIQAATQYNNSVDSVRAYCAAPYSVRRAHQKSLSLLTRGDIKDDWSSVIKLCNMRYWSRKWIIQEIISARTVVLYGGGATCPMADLENFLHQLNGPHLSSSSQHYRSQIQSTSAARLVAHRGQSGDQNEEHGLLYSLIETYADNDCHLACDNVYALYSLAGEQRRHLTIDYSSSPIEQFCEVIQYVCDHESLPPARAPAFAMLLKRLLRLSDDEIAQQRRLLKGIPLTVSASVFRMHVQPESNKSLQIRSVLTPLKPIPTFLLRRSRSADWSMVSREVDIPYLVGRPDMAYFSIHGSPFVGLAACRLEPQDVVWHFRGTKHVFVVRQGMDGTIRIVGRAFVFRSGEAPSDEKKYEQWARGELNLDDVPKREHTLSLSYAELLQLISYATDVGVLSRHRGSLQLGTRIIACENHVCMHSCPHAVMACWDRRSDKHKLLITGGACAVMVLAIVLGVTIPLTTGGGAAAGAAAGSSSATASTATTTAAASGGSGGGGCCSCCCCCCCC